MIAHKPGNLEPTAGWRVAFPGDSAGFWSGLRVFFAACLSEKDFAPPPHQFPGHSCISFLPFLQYPEMYLTLYLLQSLLVRSLCLPPMSSPATVPLADDAPVTKSQLPPMITCLCHLKPLWESKMDSLSLPIQSPKSATNCYSNLLAKISTVTHIPKIFQFQNPPEQPRKDYSASPVVFSPTQPDPASDNSCSPISLIPPI